MANQSAEKNRCTSCGHVVAKTSINSSSVGYRHVVNSTKTLDDIKESLDYLVRFIKGSYKVRAFADKFSEDLQLLLDSQEDIHNIRIWLLGFVTDTDEVQLYQFLQAEYTGDINETFTDLYNRYCEYVDDPLNKNRVSRALSAFGLKTVMKKVLRNNKQTCAIMVCAKAEEISELMHKNGFDSNRVDTD
jgi:hypothetical protein